MLLSYWNQSINLHSESIDWFLYMGNTGTWWVKVSNADVKATTVDNIRLISYYPEEKTQPAFTCSKAVMETAEQCVKFVQS